MNALCVSFPKTPYFTNIILPFENKAGTPSIIYTPRSIFPQFMSKSAQMLSVCVNFFGCLDFLQLRLLDFEFLGVEATSCNSMSPPLR